MNARAARPVALLLLLACVAAFAAPVRAQEERPGVIAGSVVDGEDGAPLDGVQVTLTRPDGSEEKKVTRIDGTYEFKDLALGEYQLRYQKDGYKESRIGAFPVTAEKLARADLRMPRAAKDELLDSGPAGVEEFVVVGTKAEAIEAARAESDKLVNTLNAEELSKFAASDVADALKFVPGVSVVKGQFAIIRGLEDRYSSTLYNSDPIPSPDPDRQSVQLDLFPSEIVSNIVVSKTFSPELPSNSSGGAINVITHDYPEGLEIRGSAGTSLNTNARDDFLDFNRGSPVGSPTDNGDVLGSEFGLALAGRGSLANHEVRYKAVVNQDIDYDELHGTQQGREPQRARKTIIGEPQVVQPGSLSFGELPLSDGAFDMSESERAQLNIFYGGVGFDADTEGGHRIDASAFYVEKKQQIVQLRDNGYFPGFDYTPLAEAQANGTPIVPTDAFNGVATINSWIGLDVRGEPSEPAGRGPMWYSSFSQSDSFEINRDLLVAQLNGDHQIDPLDGLHVSWSGNYARTKQSEDALGARIFYEPTDPNVIPNPNRIPLDPSALGPGLFLTGQDVGLFSNSNDITEAQYFGRLDGDYTFQPFDMLALKISAGGWFEKSRRDVDANFLESPTISGNSQFAFGGATTEELGRNLFGALDHSKGGQPTLTRETSNHSLRKLTAGSAGMKATLWEDLDVLGGLRLERILIDSDNSPFIGFTNAYGTPEIFPTANLMFDRPDNPARGESLGPPPAGTVFNDQLLGIKVVKDPETGLVDLTTRSAIESAVNGRIDETRLLPAIGLTYRLDDSWTLRAAYSQTVARPSFREMGYYVTVEPASDDLVVGNPQLVLSDVSSWDGRAEWSGDAGDLFALSAFYKRIEKPIESLVIRNPRNFEAGGSGALFRTFFNNPNTAYLWGLEGEARKNLGFIGLDFGEYFSLGGNATYINAKVRRTQAEIARSEPFFGVRPNEVALYSGYKGKRRLFAQPEWIANADITFDQPDWGTKAALVFFAISDVLDAAGTASISPDRTVGSFTLDRYLDSFSRLDFNVAQTLHTNRLGGDLVLKFSAKNLTNTTRRIIYDPSQTAHRIAEREFRVGREFSFSITYAY